MLPLCLRLPLPPAQAPLWLLSPASGNARRARGARARGTPARAGGCYPSTSRSTGAHIFRTGRTPPLAGGPPLRAGDPLRPLSLLFTSLPGPRTAPPLPPGGPEPVRRSFVGGTRSRTPLGHFLSCGDSGVFPSCFRDLWLHPESFSRPSRSSGLPHSSQTHSSLENIHFSSREILPRADTPGSFVPLPPGYPSFPRLSSARPPRFKHSGRSQYSEVAGMKPGLPNVETVQLFPLKKPCHMSWTSFCRYGEPSTLL